MVIITDWMRDNKSLNLSTSNDDGEKINLKDYSGHTDKKKIEIRCIVKGTSKNLE